MNDYCYECTGYGDDWYYKEWEEPCRMCKRNCKDYWRRGVQE